MGRPATGVCIFKALLDNEEMSRSEFCKFICLAQGHLHRIEANTYSSYYSESLNYYVYKGRIKKWTKAINKRANVIYALTDKGRRYGNWLDVHEKYREGIIANKLDKI